MGTLSRCAPLLGFVVTAACLDASTPEGPARGQVLLHVDTDAPVLSQNPQSSAFAVPIPLFDRIRFDVLPPAGETCSACSQDFAVTSEKFTTGAVSIGVPLPPGDAGWQTRVRLYPVRLEQPSGDPDPAAVIDVTVALPSIAPTGVVDVTVFLSTDTAGQPRGQDTPEVPAAGPPGPSAVGTWADAVRTGCSGQVPAGMVCVPGGAFWMGAPRDHAVPNTDPGWHRLVVVSPFFLDQTEVTVAAWRAVDATDPGVSGWSGGSTGSALEDWCTAGATAGPREALPLNCITALGARHYCQRRGGDLPTEAEFEYVIGGLGMTPYPWGTEIPQCADAVWGRNGVGVTLHFVPQACLKDSQALATLGGPEKPGWGKRDAIALPGGTIVDLAGNIGEWARDRFQLTSEPCWSPLGLLHDPSCADVSPSLGSTNVYRGGAWTYGGTSLEASSRSPIALGIADVDIGMRCMKPGT